MSDGAPKYVSPNGTVFIAGGKDANCTLAVCPVEYSVYGYRPSLAFNSALIVLYAICMAVHTFLGWRYKAWAFVAAMLLGGTDEILGYVGRLLLWQNPWNNAGFIMQIVLITIGPVFFSAAIYVLLHQIVTYISVTSSRFPPKLFYYIFIPCDIVSLILQAAGGALSSTSTGSSSSGVDIALAGLSSQVFTLAVFAGLGVDYAICSRSVWRRMRLPRRFVLCVTFLSLATMLVFIRCCYRLYELNGGYSRESKALRDQNLFIGLESVTIIIAAYSLILVHPGFVFNEDAAQLTSYSKVAPLHADAMALDPLVPRLPSHQAAHTTER